MPLVAVSVGLVFATLADRLRRGEAVAKSLIFLPMAISFVGAAVTFRLIYSYRPEGFGTNIGLLNGIMVRARAATRCLARRSDPWNNLLLMVIMIWMQTGFAMVVLSAADQGDPRRDHRGRPHRRRVGVPGVPAHHRPEHPADDRRGHDLHGDQRAEGVRHRLRDGQRGGERHRGRSPSG